MNIKISKNNLRFRVSKDELCILRDGKRLEEGIFLSNHKIVFGALIGDGESIDLHQEDDIIDLLIPVSVINHLIEAKPTKKGISREISDVLSIILEVDVMSARKRS